MPSEKAKDNKALVATCAACKKSVSTEMMVSLAGCENGRLQYYSVCVECADASWRPAGFVGIYNFRPR